MDTDTFLVHLGDSNDQFGVSLLFIVVTFFYRENGDMDYMNALVNELSDQVSARTIS